MEGHHQEWSLQVGYHCYYTTVRCRQSVNNNDILQVQWDIIGFYPTALITNLAL